MLLYEVIDLKCCIALLCLRVFYSERRFKSKNQRRMDGLNVRQC